MEHNPENSNTTRENIHEIALHAMEDLTIYNSTQMKVMIDCVGNMNPEQVGALNKWFEIYAERFGPAFLNVVEKMMSEGRIGTDASPLNILPMQSAIVEEIEHELGMAA